MIDINTILYAFLGGILPALIWLAFWLREDYRHPEPRALILRTFLLGMGSVILVLPLQNAVQNWLPGVAFVAIILWVTLEETFKLGAAYFGGLRSAADNEPVDPIIYMITAALGFAALENTLFILGPAMNGEFVSGLVTGNLRFIGSSLLHVVSSGVVGVALAFSFYKPRVRRVRMVVLALVLAIALHAVFNLAILHWDSSGAVFGFGLVWVGVVLLLLAFERVKAIAPKKEAEYN